jgi:hypothetical protein
MEMHIGIKEQMGAIQNQSLTQFTPLDPQKLITVAAKMPDVKQVHDQILMAKHKDIERADRLSKSS